MAKRLLVVSALLVAAVLPGCTWDRTEPGLLPPPVPRPHPSASSLAPEWPPQSTNPSLPVAGEQLWTTADGLGVRVRVAVHAVRRSTGATVLDWSVTPISAPNLRLGSRLPRSMDLGLTRDGDSSVHLLLAAGNRLYRPLAHHSADQFHHCLCTQLWLAQQSMRVGETALLQVAYPPLPDAVGFVDVLFGTVPPVFHVPVTPSGGVPTAREPVDLRRPGRPVTLDASVRFRYPGLPQRDQRIRIDQVVASRDFTSMAWTVESLNDQSNARTGVFGPPVNRVPPGPSIANAGGTDGPVLTPSGRRTGLQASWMTADLYGQPGYECLCTVLGLWAGGLWTRGGSVSVVTTYPALPAGTRTVDVELPGVGTLRNLRVETAPSAAAAVGPARGAPIGVWTYAPDTPPPAWTGNEWPTPLPDPAQLVHYAASVERFATPPRS